VTLDNPGYGDAPESPRYDKSKGGPPLDSELAKQIIPAEPLSELQVAAAMPNQWWRPWFYNPADGCTWHVYVGSPRWWSIARNRLRWWYLAKRGY